MDSVLNEGGQIMLVKQADLLKVYISKEDVEKLLYGEKLNAQDNDGEYVVTIILEDK